MTIFEATILGVVQGLTEFLPVSSSGHLIIVRELLGIQTADGLAFDAVLQLATICAVCVYFWRDLFILAQTGIKMILRKEVVHTNKTMLLAIIYGSIPAVIFGLFLEGFMETTFRSVHLVAVTLLAGSILMFIADKVQEKEGESMTVFRGIIIGLFQVLALFPGVSRSGATISGGRFMGLSRETATRFSFLLAFPIILGSGLKKFLDLGDAALSPMLVLGSLSAFTVGLGAIHFLVSYLKKHSLNVFVIYRLVLVALLIFFFA